MNNTLIATIILMLVSCASWAEAPKQAGTCVACHGDNGVSTNAEWPSLAGQKKTYLVDQLTAFRDGDRSNPLMAPMIANLSDADIQALAGYYSMQTPKSAANGDQSLVDQGHNRAAYCLACHGMTGVTANDEWPNLAGQQAKYLQNQLQAFKRGERVNGIMQNVLAGISADDFAALAAFFSQLPAQP